MLHANARGQTDLMFAALVVLCGSIDYLERIEPDISPVRSQVYSQHVS